MSAAAAGVDVLARCPLCGDERLAPFCRARDRLLPGQDEFEYAECRGCALVFLARRPREDDMGRFYGAAYAPHHDRTLPGRLRGAVDRNVHALAKRTHAALASGARDPLPRLRDALYGPPRPGALFVDYGCGTPKSLDKLRRRGWRTIGVDAAPDVVAAVRAAGHEALEAGPDVWERLPADVDLLRMNHVLEHVRDPRALLARARERLSPDGCLHLATPNAEGLSLRLLRARAFGLDCPRHLVLFGPGQLERLAREVGFSRVQVVQEATAKDLLRSLGYALSDLGLPAPAPDGKALPALAEACLYLPARAAALAGRADRLQAFLRP